MGENIWGTRKWIDQPRKQGRAMGTGWKKLKKGLSNIVSLKKQV